MGDLLHDFEMGWLEPRDMEAAQVSQIVGEMAERAKSWIPLCPEYPRLKGVDCDDVEGFVFKVKENYYNCNPLRDAYANRLEWWLEQDLAFMKSVLEKHSKKLQAWAQYMVKSRDEMPHWLKGSREFRGGTKAVDWPADLEEWRKMPLIDLYIAQAIGHWPEIMPEWYGEGHSEAEQMSYLRAYLALTLDDELVEIQEKAEALSAAGNACSLGFRLSGGDPRMAYQYIEVRNVIESQTETYKDLTERDMLNSVRVFDRDELYDLAKRLGAQLTGGVDLELEVYRERMSKQTYGEATKWDEARLRAAMRNDETWQSYKTTGNYRFDRKDWAKKKGVEDVFQDEGTIYVTTPRGGLEFLSIFMYANDIPKSQAPAYYAEGAVAGEGDAARMLGSTWLGNRTDPIKRVVIVDDVVESGEQQVKAQKMVREFFGPGVEVITLVACGRRKPEPRYYNEVLDTRRGEWKHVETIDPLAHEEVPTLEWGAEEYNIFDHAIYGFEMLDLKSWREAQDGKDDDEPNELCACAFPWSITDSSPSRYLRAIYGTRHERGSYRPVRRPSRT